MEFLTRVCKAIVALIEEVFPKPNVALKLTIFCTKCFKNLVTISCIPLVTLPALFTLRGNEKRVVLPEELNSG